MSRAHSNGGATTLTTRPDSTASSSDDAEVLFKEAHQRRRRRRVLLATVVAVVIAATTAAVALSTSDSGHSREAAPRRTVSQPPAPLGPTPRVSWVDYQGLVHIGSLKTHQQRVVASGTGSPTTSMVASGKTVFWVSNGATVYDKATNSVRTLPRGVMAYDAVTGRTRSFASGGQVFNAVGSPDVFVVSYDGRHLARYSLDGRVLQQFTLPKGWSLPDPFGLGTSSPALAHGAFLVQSSRVGVWTPSTGAVRGLGDSSSMVATHTDARGAASLIAWLQGSCALSENSCVLHLTDLATGVTRQIRNPLGFGFDMRGAFSPDGRQLAAFAKTNSGAYNPETRLVLIDVATGTLRSVPGATIGVGESVAWAQWLPGTRSVIAGGTSDVGGLPEANHFVVDGRTLKSTPFRFLSDGQRDVNYSVVVLP